jgi:transposase
MAYRAGGIDALRTRKAPGAVARLDEDQLEILKQLVCKGPEACKFDTGVWDGKLVQKLIRIKFGVMYSTSQVRRILRKLGFSVQYPTKVLALADEELQRTWLAVDYAKIKKKPGDKAG